MTDRHVDVVWVVGFCLAWMYSVAVKVQGPERPLRLGRWELPSVCLIRLTTGRRCPGCGMSRSFVYMFRLDVRNAVKANWLGPFAFIVTACRAVLAAWRLAAASRHLRVAAGGTFGMGIHRDVKVI